MPTIDGKNKRVCKECRTELKYNEERYELRRMTFKKFGGLSQKIALHLCPTCTEIILGDLIEEG